MINLILVSKVDIINQIFTLVVKKLSIDFEIINDDGVLHQVDIIVIDDEFVSTNIIKYKSYCDKLVLLSKENIDIKNSDFDFVLTKPFLPSQLQLFLEKINKKDIIELKKENDNLNIVDSQEEDIDDLISFVENIADDVPQDITDEYSELEQDDTVITQEDLGHGGVLDKDELSKLFDLMNDEENENNNLTTSSMKDSDWIDLGQIIDEAIEDVQEYEFDKNKPIKLILNEYSMKELSPLFKKLDQNIIDCLTNGNEISLELRLGK